VSIRSFPLVCALNLSTLLSPHQTFMALDSALTRPAASFRAFLVGVRLLQTLGGVDEGAPARCSGRACTAPCARGSAARLVAEARPEGRSRRPGASVQPRARVLQTFASMAAPLHASPASQAS
jgi:hypothetical protein